MNILKSNFNLSHYRLIGAAVLVLGLAASFMAIYFLYAWERAKAHEEFVIAAQLRVTKIQESFNYNESDLEAIAAFYSASREVESDEFRIFTKRLLNPTLGIHALEWVPLVKLAERDIHEKEGEKIFGKYEISEANAQGKLIRAGERAEYFPVTFVEPYAGNETIVGFDLTSNPVRCAAIAKSRDSGKIVASGKIKLVQGTGDQDGFLLFYPIYRNGVELDTDEHRHENIRGFSVGVYRIGDLVEAAIGRIKSDYIDIALYDDAAQHGEDFLYFHSALPHSASTPLPPPSNLSPDTEYIHTDQLVVGDRTWKLVLTASPDHFNVMPSGQAWAALLLGITLSITLAAFLESKGKHLARELKSNEARLLAEGRLTLILDSLDKLFISFIPETQDFLYINPVSAKRIIGMTPEELRRHKGLWMDMIHPDDRSLPRQWAGTPKMESWADEYRIVRADGSVRWLAEAGKYFPGKDGNTSSIDMLVSDITERKRMEAIQQLKDIQLHQTQKMESIGQLAAGVAHEINTPVQYVGDNTRFLLEAFIDYARYIEANEVILNDSEKGAPIQDAVAAAREIAGEIELDYLKTEVPKAIAQSLEGIQRISKIVNAMKEFSHPGSKEKTPVDINRSILAVVEVSRNVWKYHTELETELAPDIPLVPAIPDEINMILLNLIVNASDAIEEAKEKKGDMKGRIHVVTQRDGDWISITVSDNGCGIPASIRGRIFDPFFTTKEVGKGSGQGLALIYTAVVENHGGTIDVQSEEGKGTSFIIRLPLWSDKPGPEETLQ